MDHIRIGITYSFARCRHTGIAVIRYKIGNGAYRYELPEFVPLKPRKQSKN